MSLTPEEFERQFQRLENAVNVLRAGECLLHAIARSYYLVYLTATHAAAKYGVTVTHFRRGEELELGDFTHNAIPDVIRALYSGNKSGGVAPGATPGIGSGHFSDGQAMRFANLLRADRKSADYGPTAVLEPYAAQAADERLTWAKMLVDDLRKIL